MHMFAFLYFSSLYLSIKTRESLYIFVPQKMPSSSNKLEDIKGYVATNPLVKIFRLAANFTSLLFSTIGKQDKNNCSCLKLALLVFRPILSKMPSTLFIKYSCSLISSENTLI